MAESKKTGKSTPNKTAGFQPFKTTIDGKEVVVDGIGMPKEMLASPAPTSQSAGDVTAHHFSWNGYHLDWQYGWVMDVYGNLLYVRHCHPYGTAYVIW